MDCRKRHLRCKKKSFLQTFFSTFNIHTFEYPYVTLSVFLKSIKDIGLKIGLLTNNGKFATNIVLEKHGIAKFFDVIITRDDSQALKPDPTGLRLVLSALNISPKEAVFVGDSIIDAHAAKEVGVTFFGVETGLHNKGELQRENAVMVFSDLKSLLKFIIRKVKK